MKTDMKSKKFTQDKARQSTKGCPVRVAAKQINPEYVMKFETTIGKRQRSRHGILLSRREGLECSSHASKGLGWLEDDIFKSDVFQA